MDVGYMTRRIMGDLNTLEPSKCAVKLESELSWTYEELHRVSNAYGNVLRNSGVKKGDRVGILLYNCLEYFALYFGAAKIGAIAVRLNFRLASQEFEYALNDSGCKILCFHSSLTDRIEPIRNAVSVEDYICLPYQGEPVPPWAKPWDVLTNGETSEITNITLEPSDPVMLMYTSGTTGRPKGALWTHANTLWFSAMQVMKWNLHAGTVCMTTGPLYHVGGMEDLALPALLVGGTVVITKSGGFSIDRVVRTIEQENVTDCFLFPFMIYEMLNSSRSADFKLSRLKRIYSGGDPVMPWAIEQLNERFPHVGLVQVYGLTEGTPIAAALDPSDSRKKGHTVGKPMPLTEIKIVDDRGQSVPIGETGEICIKSPAVSQGYWQKPAATAATFVDGWCHTGDLGRIDKDGYLSIVGRKKDMIRSGGENIYPVEIEDVLIRHPAVKDVAVIGIPDPKYIETVCAVIVLKQEMKATEDDIIRFATQHLASYKKPRKVVFVKEIPRTPSGKIQKYILREKYGSTENVC
ncbi:class I adenylate-forming enzyme family protein [Polycladomyces subterraneus]|uniref:Long-chain-fatty-acid--CoA ligase n=1 Tax=Polycladomyces subterraneus TaxID=1016997 RepID=A0ABT8IKL4_9BACL|nr:long-chain-fatty-acid--CoA ligase [Polycladomyces subterraneus]MDN4593306.1 long-chain-fatty-acid--CoA ligase [Polycladomyces subterraneus]